MEKSEIIKILEEPAIEVMKQKKILVSILIAESIRILYKDNMSSCYEDLIIGNNPMAVEATESFKGEKIYNEKTKTMYRTYETLEEGIANYITLHETDKFDIIKEIYNYKDALNKLSSKFYNVTELEKYIMAYQLNTIDQNVLKQMYPGKRNVIETDINSETADLMKMLVDIHAGVGLNMTASEFENEENNNVRVLQESINNKIDTRTLKKGTTVKLHNANLYNSLKANTPTRCITGEFYLLDGIYKYHRYAIVMKQQYVGNSNMIMGYIDEDQIRL